MPRRKNPLTELPVPAIDTSLESTETPVFLETELEQTRSNVVPLTVAHQPISESQNWVEIDSVLADVVSIG